MYVVVLMGICNLALSTGMLPFAHREFAFQLRDGTFLRYYSFEKIAELKATLKKHTPVAVSLGAVYSEQVTVRAWWNLLSGTLTAHALLVCSPSDTSKSGLERIVSVPKS